MKKELFISMIVLFLTQTVFAEDFTIFSGRASTKTQFFGVSFGGEIFDFLFINLDFFKYIKEDESLSSPIPEQNRGKFLAGSLNFDLKIPIHLIPHLDKLEFIQPYILLGYGLGIENLSNDYINFPDINGKKGFFTKTRQFYSSGFGVILMISSSIGFKMDYRMINISEHKKMEYPSRKFSRIYFGLCLGRYKESDKPNKNN